MANQELQCPFCDKTSSRGTGLASHIRGSHPKQYPGWKKNRGNPQRAQASEPPARVTEITGGLKGIIASLEHQRNAIEMALTALRAVEGLNFEDNGEAARPAATAVKTATEKTSTKTKAARKGRVTPEGRERLSAAMKKRWAAKRAAPAAKKGRPKKKAAA